MTWILFKPELMRRSNYRFYNSDIFCNDHPTLNANSVYCHCPPVCLSVWVSVLSMFAAHRAPVSQPSLPPDTGLLNRFGLALHGHSGQGLTRCGGGREEAWLVTMELREVITLLNTSTMHVKSSLR